MANNETQRLARKWVQKTNPKGDRETLAAMEHIMATTEPLTMADAEWNHDEHALAGATLDYGYGTTDVIMLDKEDDGFISYIAPDYRHGYAYPQFFTPNGKRYAFYEVAPTVSSNENAADKQAELATLETVEDYVNAPHGTVVAEPGGYAWTKDNDGEWSGNGIWPTSHELSGTKRQELRKGWGK